MLGRRSRTAAAGPPPTPTLTDPDLDARLHRDGYVVWPDPLVDEATCDRLRALFFELHGPKGEGWHNSFNTLDMAYRRGAWSAIQDAFGDTLRARFTGFEPFNCVFLCKWPGEDSYLYWHQDWMYVDERRGPRAYAAMVALEDITEENGRVHVVAGSHQLDPMVRGTHLYFPWSDYDRTLTDRSTAVPMAKGHGALWDSSLVHYSSANTTDQPRLAVAIGMKPIGEQLVHFRREDDTTAAMYDVDLSFYTDGDPYRLMDGPPDFPLADRLPTRERPWSDEELAARIDQLQSPR